MSLPHALSGQTMDVSPYHHNLAEQRTVALFKSRQLEVIRLVLPAGKAMPLHQISSEITIQCIEGVLDVEVDGVSTVMQAGQLMFLHGSVPHSVTAMHHASALLTVVLPHES